ncbi:STAS domain-containing protein [Chitinibacter sp. GC72]|uniref:STAS domain-containing protein n=1 Tax=Chitinibacter sp. GC72 TaxID=1526917 RepID=UPI0012FAB103|nr:STAS domain-containing protein [Chitinibacter sp. GC72]
MDAMQFTFSDLIMGYVKAFEWERKEYFILSTSDGREFEVKLGDNCYAEIIRNLGEGFISTEQIQNMLKPGRFCFVYGIFYPENGVTRFEAKHIVFAGRNEDAYVFEQQDWWVRQIRQLADFYVNAEFGDGPIDYRHYRTQITADGRTTGDYRQETDTISRLVYGFASAYLLTGNDRYLEAAEEGTNYLRDHFRCQNASEQYCYWYHAIDVVGDHERKIFASEFGDDFDALPAYEQIYALAGPTQTFRITGDTRIASDIQQTINMFQKYYLDPKQGGYWSHLDPVTFDGEAESLDRNRARKNWNSVGDHAPAYLINAVLATDRAEWKTMLEYCADTITQHFPDYANSAFVNEKFHADWSHDQTWGWQQNRAVVGHNLKIAWNLSRIRSMVDKPEYREFATRIASLMPEHGMDKQRGGWYDVVARTLGEGEQWHRFAWHDRKAWWQQEQGILAYLIMYGLDKKPEYQKLARESSAFYNAWFLDHDVGGVYFNVLANGMPYMLGNERMKGSHSMAGYHSFELCYLAAVYTNLLITRQPLDLFFKPRPEADRTLRVAPDMLPTGSVRIESVTIDGQPFTGFDAEALTVQLPVSDTALRVKVQLMPTDGLVHFNLVVDGNCMTLTGDLDTLAAPYFRTRLAELIASNPDNVTLDVSKLAHLSDAGLRVLAFERGKLSAGGRLTIIGANDEIKSKLMAEELGEEVVLA